MLFARVSSVRLLFGMRCCELMTSLILFENFLHNTNNNNNHKEKENGLTLNFERNPVNFTDTDTSRWKRTAVWGQV